MTAIHLLDPITSLPPVGRRRRKQMTGTATGRHDRPRVEELVSWLGNIADIRLYWCGDCHTFTGPNNSTAPVGRRRRKQMTGTATGRHDRPRVEELASWLGNISDIRLYRCGDCHTFTGPNNSTALCWQEKEEAEDRDSYRNTWQAQSGGISILIREYIWHQAL